MNIKSSFKGLLLCLGLGASTVALAQPNCSVRYETLNSWTSNNIANALHDVVFTNLGEDLSQWELSWRFPGEEIVENLWRGTVSQNGAAVSVSNASYNGNLPNGASVDFGFIVRRFSKTTPVEFFLNGRPCSASEDADDSDNMPDGGGGGDGGATPNAVLQLDSSESRLTFVTVKNTNRAEVNTFLNLSGSISTSGAATLAIGLDSIDSAVAIRDSRMREFLFETPLTPTLYYQVQLDRPALSAMDIGDATVTTFSGSLILHGIRKAVDARVLITKAGENDFVLSTFEPINIRAADFDLDGGINTLRGIANLMNISETVPVYFRLRFTASDTATSVVVPTTPMAADNLGAELNADNTADLNWRDNSTNETLFIARARNNRGFWNTVGNVVRDTTSLMNVAAASGSTDFKIIALNGSVPSDSSNLASVEVAVEDQGDGDNDGNGDGNGDGGNGNGDGDNNGDGGSGSGGNTGGTGGGNTGGGGSGGNGPTGEQLYAAQCAICHGDNGDGFPIGVPLNTDIDLTYFIDYTETNMPPGLSDDCDRTCAELIGAYAADTFLNTAMVMMEEIPGPRQLSLLSRYQYQNTVQSLFGIDVNVVINFPVEAIVNGFDNNAELNLVSARHVVEYLDAADTVARLAVDQNRSRIVNCDLRQDNCKRQFVTNFGRRVFRRPLSNTEINQYVSAFSEEATENDGLKLVLRSMLSSPSFLYLSEMGQRDGDDFRLTQFELATVLSYMFTGTTPNEALLNLAAANGLSTPEQLKTAAENLLGSPQARENLGHFVEQWLEADRNQVGSKDAQVYPRFNANVRDAMDAEMKAFFNHVVFESTQEFAELYNADYVMVNNVLANYYNIPGVEGSQFRPVIDPSGNRGGLLSLGAFMASHSQSNESSPIVRGRAVRKRIQCQAFPSPPADLDVSFPDPDPNLTTREKFALRTAAPQCQQCHTFLNGVGFGFEAFDGAGGFRLLDNNKPVDDSGFILGLNNLSGDDNTPFDGVKEMQAIFAEADGTKACVARQFYRFARGYADTSTDSNTLTNLFMLFEQNNFNLQAMMVGVTQLPTFSLRRDR